MRRAILLAFVLPLSACANDAVPDPEGDYFEGTAYDEGRTDAPPGFEKADLAAPYTAPSDLPTLLRPEIIVSRSNATVHLFDRATGFSRVYPTGLGALSSSGTSYTPTGHFATSPDTSDRWWYVATRWEPAYFEGYPFVRLTAENSRGFNTYGFHGPITDPLQRGYVSHGCMRMEKPDIVELFVLVREHASTPVTIQQEVELDAAGNEVDIDTEVTLWAPGEEIQFGASVGPRDDRPLGFVGDPCASDADCGTFGGDAFFCHAAGFCSVVCEGYCPDLGGYPSTFCAADPASPGQGACVQLVDGRNADCALIEGTVPEDRDRFVGTSGAPAATARVCAIP